VAEADTAVADPEVVGIDPVVGPVADAQVAVGPVAVGPVADAPVVAVVGHAPRRNPQTIKSRALRFRASSLRTFRMPCSV